VAAEVKSASNNVVIEDLHSTRNLETTYYVTDVTQASDFYWDRESGLRVNIGIHDVQLIAEYIDVDHEELDDSQFILDGLSACVTLCSVYVTDRRTDRRTDSLRW